MKFKYSDIFDGECTVEEYYGQFEKPKCLAIGETYRQNSSIYHKDYRIIWADEKTAIGEVVSDGNCNSNVGERVMFDNSELRRGFKHSDTRPCYRLVTIK